MYLVGLHMQSKAIPLQAWGGPEEFKEFEAPGFQDNRYMKVAKLSALGTGRLYPSGNISGIHFCYRLSRPQGYSAAGRIMSMKYYSDTIGNRTRDLPTCSAVPQPTAPQRALWPMMMINIGLTIFIFCSKPMSLTPTRCSSQYTSPPHSDLPKTALAYHPSCACPFITAS